jgi:cytochrome c
MKTMKPVLLTFAALTAVAAAFPALAADESALAKSKNCLTCHMVDKKLVGPAYKDVAAKFASQPDAVATLGKAILTGSKGVWGPVPMPANTTVSPDEAKRLATWILSLK